MATVDVGSVSIPGLRQPFTKHDLMESAAMYNSLPRIQSEMHVDMDHVKELVEIIVRHDQLRRFSFHLIHRHDPIVTGTVRLESGLGAVPGKWNKATSIDSLDISNIHGAIFKFLPEQSRLVPFEFGEGPSPVSMSDENDKFVREFTGHLTKNNLSDIFALEVVHPSEGGEPNECTAEVEVDKLGTVVLPKSMVNAKEFIPTGWPGPLQPGDSEPPKGQTWAKKVDESHKVFINKPIRDARDLVDELVRQGIIKV